jgi:thiamine biosynthesis lipoprotein
VIATEVALARSDADAPRAAVVSAGADLMGGRVSVHARPSADLAPDDAARAVRVLLARIDAWAGRLTRFDPASELSRLNAAAGARVDVGPTVTAVLDWGRGAEILSDGIVDVALLDARLRAEAGPGPGDGAPDEPFLQASRRWSLTRRGRGAAVERPAGLRFDLDGVAKGWLADRALDLLAGASAVVDADGDIAVRVADEEGWAVGVEDPREPGTLLAVLHLDRRGERAARFGVATSGTSVHRWSGGGRMRHHLIDPRTGRPAETDIVQATVIARTARAAEAFAKTAVIVGSEAALHRLDRSDVLGQMLVTEGGAVLVTPSTLEYLS